ncbi:Peptidase C1A, papain [Corchorus olitorius]|uniref:Peptidase C1A, papain n=1 Tax=Corchorus olitorius TaxID=93759 RepID=A0A1R3HHX1_9ROSI|nr:Peptidase C1A, papain [Corchorus olitorius]
MDGSVWRVYKDLNDKAKHFRIFKENVAFIDSFNAANNKPYKLGLNQFADVTNEELTASQNRFKGHMCSNTATSFKYENVTAVLYHLLWIEERKKL